MNKDLKKAIYDHYIGNGNAALRYFMNNNIKLKNGIVYKNGVPIAKIKRQYSSKKINGCYKEIKPKIIEL